MLKGKILKWSWKDKASWVEVSSGKTCSRKKEDANNVNPLQKHVLQTCGSLLQTGVPHVALGAQGVQALGHSMPGYIGTNLVS